MSSHKCQESEVMVRQVNLVAAFHDHISCTKISQQTIGSNICGLQSVGDMSQSQTQTHESDHMYATDNKCANHSIINNNNNNNNNNNENTTNSNSNSNGIINNNLFVNNLSDERNQIQKLTEMILAQLDLIQHQQEQLLKKDRQLQGLKQDREALCLRLEKMEKRIAVLTTKVANNQINNNLNLTRNIANSNNSSNTTETDCDQSGSDTIIEDNNSVIGLFTDPTVFAKLYSQSSGVTTININNLNNNNNSSNTNMNNTITNTSTNTCNSITTVRIKSEPQNTIDSEENMATITTTNTTMTSTASARKNRKRHPEVIPPSSTSTIPSNKKRGKGLNVSTNIDINNVDIKKEPLSSSDSLRTSQTIKTYSNKKKANKLKSETSANTLNFKTTSLTKDILTTTKPYSITVNRIHSPLDLCVVNSCSNTDINNTNTFNNNNNSSVEEKNMSSTISDIIQVPNWKLHPVSSCYSLEGTENLDDEVFNRRHLKLEIDERRRKRWDIQRLREQRQNEKLRTGRYYSGSLVNCFIEKPSDLKRKSCEFTSFFPDIKNVQSIEVSEKLPVIAFGHSIPRLPSKSFSLPWNIISEKPQTTAKTRNSTVKKH